MKKFTSCFTILFCIYLASTMVSAQGSDRLSGEWMNSNPRTRGITSIVVVDGGSGWSVEAWGKCHPTDCVWGKTKLTPIGDSVEDDSFDRGFAVWEPGFASKYVEFAMDGGLLRVEIITIFKDRSRRSSFRSVEYFRRAEQRMQ
jgi:hypothetical protein